jgi:hypothetical protein
MMKKLLLCLAFFATTTLTFAQDALSWDPQDATYNAATTLDIKFKYTSATPIPAGGIKIELWSVSVPWNQGWRQWTQNWSELPAGTDQTATLTLNNFPASISSGGVLMTDAQLLAANPNGMSSPTGYYYEVRLLLGGGDGSFTPTGTADRSYIHVSPSLSLSDVSLNSIKVFPNPAKEIITIPNYSDFKSLIIYDILGKEIKTSKSQEVINVADLNSGVYIIKSDNGKSSRFIKD